MRESPLAGARRAVMNHENISIGQHPTARLLPIAEVIESVVGSMADQHQLIVEAPPGAGKTTVLPLALLDSQWLDNRKIILIQPRRIAALNAAARMADLLGETIGETVGYRVRLDSKVGPATRIEVVTEGVLLRMLTEDPSLADTGLVIFDEFHERSLNADLSLALALHGRQVFERDQPLKLLVMSATLAQTELAAYLGARVIRSEGKTYPVAVHYRPAPQHRREWISHLCNTIEDAIRSHPTSSLLVFLPGQGEIRRVQDGLKLPSDISVHPLLGSLSIEAQQKAIAPSRDGRRKVVLGTNVAETSLTIEGIDVVIDAGLERRPLFDPNTGMTRLTTVQVSRASADQRCGRAGRTAPGSCYRLWSESQHDKLTAHAPPEIETADLADLALQLFAWGVYDPRELQWLTAPPPGPYAQALELLQKLGAVTSDQSGPAITPHGTAMANVAAHPRLAHMLISASRFGAIRRGAQLAAVLSDRDPVSADGPDMDTRLDYLESRTACPPRYRRWRSRTLQLAEQFESRIARPPVTSLQRPEPSQLTGFLLACAYPDRVARRRHNGGFQLSNGRTARFTDTTTLDGAQWLVVTEAGGAAGQRGDRIYSAATLDPGLFDSVLSKMIENDTLIGWDSHSGRFIAERQRRIGALLLSKEALSEVPEGARTDKLIALVREKNLKNLSWDRRALDFVARVQLLRTLHPEFPDFSSKALLASIEEWLAPHVSSVKRLDELKKLDLAELLRWRLSWRQQQELDQLLPERFTVPSGSKISIDYQTAPPTLAVKLQEMFGATTTPAIADGRIPLTLQLLSPAGRPLQVTSDLASFWRDGYSDVRKDMRGRYPKHPWPEDPITAVATRHTKKRAARQ